MARKPTTEGRQALADHGPINRPEEVRRLIVERHADRFQPQRRWLIGLYRSFGFAFDGLAAMLRSQRNAQIHVVIAAAVLLAGVFFRVSWGEWLALVLAMTLVLALEALNTAIEAVVDLVSPQPHPLAKRAKDVAAAAVLIGAIGTALVGCLVFLPKLLALVL